MTCELRKEYIDARYELALIDNKGKIVTYAHPPRFNTAPPESVWLDSEKIWEWIRENKIPPCIMKP